MLSTRKTGGLALAAGNSRRGEIEAGGRDLSRYGVHRGGAGPFDAQPRELTIQIV